MSHDERPVPNDPLVELRFALAEGDAVDPQAELRARVLAAASDARAPGRAVEPPTPISGAEAFRRTVARLDALLDDLSPADWSRPALRDLDVQGLVGHLIGVEEAFAAAFTSPPDHAALDHIASTQPAAIRQAGCPPLATHREWFDAATASIAMAGTRDATETISFYGVTLPVDSMLVVRGFEMWTHDEDIRRATGRPLGAPDPERLARMIGLVTTLLPAGIARAGRARPATTRLVLTGAGGGTWDVNLDGSTASRPAVSRIVVDGAAFCRVVGNRADQQSAGAAVSGDSKIAADVLIGAAALALD
jgi:uncharacterized protein (TIGR03083 family)